MSEVSRSHEGRVSAAADAMEALDGGRTNLYRKSWEELARAALVESEAREREHTADLVGEVASLKARETALVDTLRAADWLIRCLNDVAAKKVVRGLPEAEGAYARLAALVGVIEAEPDGSKQ